MKKIIFTLVIFLTTTFSFGQNGTEPITITDMMKIKTVGSVNLNKDGSQAVFTVTEINPDADNKWDYKNQTQIWLINTAGVSSPRRLTAKENASQPVWHPDGKQIAFVRAVDGKPQIFTLSLDGGEAVQLTNFRYGASNPKWSPDGKQILFSSSIRMEDLLKDSVLNPNHLVPEWPYEKPGFANNENLKPEDAIPDPDGNQQQIRAYLNNNEKDHKAVVLNKLNFQNEMDVGGELVFNQFFILNTGNPSNPVLLTKLFHRFNQATFTPDGKQVVMAGKYRFVHTS